MSKLKYSDLTPFRWYPVEEVEFAVLSDVFTASVDCFGRWELRWRPNPDNECRFWDDGEPCDVRFVMRLLTPDEMEHQSAVKAVTKSWENVRRRIALETLRYGDVTKGRAIRIAKEEAGKLAVPSGSYLVILDEPCPLPSKFVRGNDEGLWEVCEEGEHHGEIVGGPYPDGETHVRVAINGNRFVVR